MESHMQDYTLPGATLHALPGYPHAPVDWNPEAAARMADAEGLVLTDEHWQVLRALQDFYARHGGDASINVRGLHDALDEHFHPQGGIKHLFDIFPGGPVAQGCRLAGLPLPAGAVDRGFGSVV